MEPRSHVRLNMICLTQTVQGQWVGTYVYTMHALQIIMWKREQNSHRLYQVRVRCTYGPGHTYDNLATLGRSLWRKRVRIRTASDPVDQPQWNLVQMMQIV